MSGFAGTRGTSGSEPDGAPPAPPGVLVAAGRGTRWRCSSSLAHSVQASGFKRSSMASPWRRDAPHARGLQGPYTSDRVSCLRGGWEGERWAWGEECVVLKRRVFVTRETLN